MPLLVLCSKKNGAKCKKSVQNLQRLYVEGVSSNKGAPQQMQNSYTVCLVLKIRINFIRFVFLSIWARFALVHWEYMMQK